MVDAIQRQPVEPQHAEVSRKAKRPPASSGRRLKVLYVVSMFPCWSETFIAREIKVLLDQGVDIRILSLRPWKEQFRQAEMVTMMDRVSYAPSDLRCLLASVTNVLRHPSRESRWPLLLLRHLWRRPVELAKSLVTWVRLQGAMPELRKLSPDHVHAHWATYPSTAAMMLADALDCPFSFTAHAHDIFLHDQLMNQKLERAAFVATISDYNRRLMRERYPAAISSRIEIVHCGVAGIAGISPQQPEENALFSVGRLDPIKGFDTLVEACALLEKSGVSFQCDIVGDGEQVDALSQRIWQLGLGSRIHLLGAMPSEEVETKLRRSSVFVLACRRTPEGNMDGIPVALMEAMASGIPVVSTRVSGIPELVIDEVNGLLVDPEDPNQLARAMKRLLDDPLLRARLGAAGRNKVRNDFNAETETKKLLRLFTQVAEKRARRAACVESY